MVIMLDGNVMPLRWFARKEWRLDRTSASFALPQFFHAADGKVHDSLVMTVQTPCASPEALPGAGQF
jgi:hypothetical protein